MWHGCLPAYRVCLATGLGRRGRYADSVSGTAFVVLAHKGPEQVARLVSALSPSTVYLHVDRRTPPDMAAAILDRSTAVGDVRAIPRVRSGWASWGQVVAALRGVELALEGGARHVVHLTGQDYPLRSVADVDAFLGAHVGSSFVASAPIPTPILGPDGGIARFNDWHIPVRGRRVHVPLRRKPPPGLRPYWNQAQWCLAAPLGRRLVECLRHGADLTSYFKRTWMPDESFVATMAQLIDPGSVINENLWHVRWEDRSSHPAVLRCHDVEELALASYVGGEVGGASRVKLFARKFDRHVDNHVLCLLDEHRSQSNGHPFGAG